MIISTGVVKLQEHLYSQLHPDAASETVAPRLPGRRDFIETLEPPPEQAPQQGTVTECPWSNWTQNMHTHAERKSFGIKEINKMHPKNIIFREVE